MTETRVCQTGEIVGRRVDGDGQEEIAVVVTLPGAQWDRITDWVNDLHHREGEDRPDIPLDARIAVFLDLQTQIWAYDVRQQLGGSDDDDLDDGVPLG